MHSLREKFNSPDSRISCTVMFIEMTNAIPMKESQP